MLFTAEQATEIGRGKELLLIAKNKLINDNERLAAAKDKEAIEERLSGSLASIVVALVRGATIFRVHDVKESVEAIRMANAIMGGS